LFCITADFAEWQMAIEQNYQNMGFSSSVSRYFVFNLIHIKQDLPNERKERYITVSIFILTPLRNTACYARSRLDHSFFCGIITAHSLDEMPAGVQLLSDNQLDGYRAMQWRLKV
jgi:hypothetical protein